jgi:hypothetical protein
MNQLRLFSLSLLACMVFASCGNGKDDDNNPDSLNSVNAGSPAKLPVIMAITHKVANFAKWKAAYDAHDSARLAAGLHSFAIARGIEDSNRVLVAIRVEDTAKARQFSTSPDLKATMQKAGVTGAPTMRTDQLVMLDTTTNSTTTRVMIVHKVKDYDAWKKTFDSHRQARMDAGLKDRILSRNLDDPNLVTVVCAITDMAKAKAFMASKDLKDKMAAAGVEGPPEIFMYNVVQSY